MVALHIYNGAKNVCLNALSSQTKGQIGKLRPDSKALDPGDGCLDPGDGCLDPGDGCLDPGDGC